MFRFAYPGILFLLLLVPFVIGLYLLSRQIRKKRLEKFGKIKLIDNLMPEYSHAKPIIRICIGSIALAAIIFALARPWGGIKNQETSKEGIEIVIAVDASNSMLASASDDENGIDRMRTSKMLLEKLINKLSNDRVGLIAYAGDAYTLIPVTNDYISAKSFLNSIEPSQIPHQGTNIAAAIDKAMNSFSPEKNIGKSIILLTDAEELENPEGVISQVKQAAKSGVQVNVIGIGSQPVSIPFGQGGRLMDPETGEAVRTALNEDLAIDIAGAGEGIYVNASNPEALDELSKQMGKLKKATLESSFLVSHDELYYIFVIIALVALIIDFVMTDKVNKWIVKLNLFKKGRGLTSAILLLFLVPLTMSCAKGASESKEEYTASNDSILSLYSLPEEAKLIEEGNRQYYSMNFETADSAYQAALNVNPNSVVSYLNDGVSAIRSVIEIGSDRDSYQPSDSMKMVSYMEKAANLWQQASSKYINKGNVSSLAFYNLGNLSFTQEDYNSAIEQYKEALRLNPADESARRNLRIAQLKRQETQQDNQNQQEDQQQQQNQQQEQKEQQQEQQQQNRQEINEQTSEQILNAAERKENQKRVQMQIQNNENSERPGRSYKNW